MGFAPMREYGAGNEVRTRDLHLGKVALYQLSYSRPGTCDSRIRQISYAICLKQQAIYSLYSRANRPVLAVFASPQDSPF